MIDFRPIATKDKTEYERLAKGRKYYCCETSFGNLFLWGDQKLSFMDGNVVFLATFSRSFYLFPIGEGDKKVVIEKLINDAKERNIPFVMSSISPEEKEFLEITFPDKFEFETSENSYDYVYDIDDLSGLLGKKYHKKRNHLARFYKEHENYSVESFNKENVEKIKALVNAWYDEREGDFEYEKEVFARAIDNFDELGLEGLALVDNGQVLAVTFASRFKEDTFDVHFEKARADVDGAYTAINNEFAKYIKNKYPEIRYLNREEDMGVLGLRKAKQSYYPTFRVVKYKAKLK